MFSDTGVEWPHTYKYLEYMDDVLAKHGQSILYFTGGILRPKFKGAHMTLLEHCQMLNMIPSRMNRWCTDYWKIQPLRLFAKAVDACQWIGIDYGEQHRAKAKKNFSYPLIDFELNRNRCQEVIRQAGLGVPLKSGCFICPYQRKSGWARLKKEHPGLWEIAVKLEQSAIQRSDKFTFVDGMTISEYVADHDKQESLSMGFVLDQKCECYFD